MLDEWLRENSTDSTIFMTDNIAKVSELETEFSSPDQVESALKAEPDSSKLNPREVVYYYYHQAYKLRGKYKLRVTSYFKYYSELVF